MIREYVNLANALTSGSLAAGFVALFLIFKNDDLFVVAGLVALAAVFDALDGYAARRTGNDEGDGGEFGSNLDSLADVVSFGAVPAFAIYWASLYALPVVLVLSFLMVCALPFPTLSGLRNREELAEEVEEYRQTRRAEG